jgi:hypothetical protein
MMITGHCSPSMVKQGSEEEQLIVGAKRYTVVMIFRLTLYLPFAVENSL